MIDRKGYKCVLLFGSTHPDGGNMESHCSHDDIYEDSQTAALAMLVKMARVDGGLDPFEIPTAYRGRKAMINCSLKDEEGG